MKKLLLATALLLGLSGSAWAQKSKSALTTEVNTNLASNSNISASILRTTLLDVINSFYDLGGASTLSCGANNWIAGFPTLSSINCIQPGFTSLLGTLQASQFPALTGDVTTTAGALATTLATVNANVGTFGSATSCITVTNNAKGLTTAISAATCTPAIGSVTGLGTGVATALGINVGTTGSFITNGGALGTPTSGVATNLTGTASGLTAGNVTTNANLTGPITSVGNATAVAAQTGTGTTFVMNTSPTLVTPVIGAASGTSLALTGGGLTFSTVGQGVVGTTGANNASAGVVGEYISSIIPAATPVALTSGNAATITSISLTAGDWDVDCNVGFIPTATTSITVLYGGISLTTNTLDTSAGRTVGMSMAAVVSGGLNFFMPVPPIRLSLSATTTIYMIGYSTFSASTLTSYGILRARRVW